MDTLQVDWAEFARRLEAPDGGFSVDVVTGEEPQEGFMVGVEGCEKVLFVQEVTGEVVKKFVEGLPDKVRKEGFFVGGWHSPGEGRVYLDVSIRAATPVHAEWFCAVYRQKAYFDLGRGESVEVVGRLPGEGRELL